MFPGSSHPLVHRCAIAAMLLATLTVHAQPSVSGLAFVETSSAAFRLRKGGSLTDEQASAIADAATRQLALLSHVLVSRALIDEAARLTKAYSIRSLDAIQLASALRAQSALGDPSLRFISAGISLLACASAEGSQTWNPCNLADSI